MKTISVEVSEEFDRQLRIKAALLDMNRPQLIRKILEEKMMHCNDEIRQPSSDSAGHTELPIVPSLMSPSEKVTLPSPEQ
jgi:hypothetical protein